VASIRERTSSSGERVVAVLFRHGGKQRSRTFSDPKMAEKFRQIVDLLGPDKALAELLAADQDDRLTVDELATRFLDWKARDVTVRTMTDYRRDYVKWVKPRLGDRAAESVDETDVQAWVDDMATQLSPKSVADRHMLLHAMYDYGRAKSRRLVTHNPCLETDLPKRVKKPPKGTTVPEWRAILTAAARRNPDARDLILFLGSVGWRFSEAIALGVRDVEDDGEQVTVTVTRVFRLDGSSRQMIAEDEAKSYAAFRRVALPTEAAAMIRRRVVGKGPSDLVFTNSRGNHWNQSTFLRETWPRIVADARADGGLSEERRPTPHWLRHMAVQVMIAAGAQLPEVQRTIGHEHISTTIDVYGGMIGGLPSSTLANVDRILTGAAGGQVVSGTVLESLVGPDTEEPLLGGVQVLQPKPDPVLGELE
jgi:integrase